MAVGDAIRASCCSCLDGICEYFERRQNDDKEREDFERTVAFLRSVPLFRNQLPRSELPKVAQILKRKVWAKGQELVHPGAVGRAFFLIQSGEARLLTSPGPGMLVQVRATLFAGDYFGGHTLTTEQPNIATIVAGGTTPLVTLSMSRRAFDEAGLRRWLSFPKRPALYGDYPFVPSPGSGGASPEVSPTRAKPPAEEAFLFGAVRRNVNLRALLEATDDQLRGICAAAEKREVPKGAVVARRGEIGDEFFVVRSGSFEIVLGDPLQELCLERGQSAEAAVASSTMAERLLRKQHFLQALSQHSTANGCAASAKKAASVAGCGAQRKFYSFSLALYTLSAGGTPAAAKQAAQAKEVPLLPKPRSKRHARQPRQGKISRRESSAAVMGGMPSFFYGIEEEPTGFCRYVSHASERALESDGDEDENAALILGVGESFGELSLLYNTRREATFQAHEDAVVYVVGRQHFRACFSRRGHRFNEYCKLLEDVHALSPLVSSERWELACSVTGLVEFKPGERVLTQGKVQARQWYVIFSGSCVMSLNKAEADGGAVVPKRLAEIRRAGCFGERSLLRGDTCYEVNVDAGREGMTCLTFNGETVRLILEKIYSHSSEFLPCVWSDIEDWCNEKNRHFDQQMGVPTQSTACAETLDTQLSELTKVCVLGRGSYAQVTLVQARTGKRYALKTLSRGHIQQMGAERLITWERELLSLVDSTFIVRLHRTFKDTQCVYFLLEAALGGTLMDLLNHHPEVFLEDAPRGSNTAFYVACLTAALEHLHERRIVHRDLKPENAMLDERGYAKLCDMGFARFVLGKTNTLAGTPDYMAPEVIDFPHSHGIPVDWWALGVLTYELLAGQPPFEDEGIADPMARILAIRRSQERGQILYPFSFPQPARGLVSRLLQKLPHRLGASGGAPEVRANVFFARMPFDFAALESGQLRSPFSKEWCDPEVYLADDFGLERGYLGLDTSDSIYSAPVKDSSTWADDF